MTIFPGSYSSDTLSCIWHLHGGSHGSGLPAGCAGYVILGSWFPPPADGFQTSNLQLVDSMLIVSVNFGNFGRVFVPSIAWASWLVLPSLRCRLVAVWFVCLRFLYRFYYASVDMYMFSMRMVSFSFYACLALIWLLASTSRSSHSLIESLKFSLSDAKFLI